MTDKVRQMMRETCAYMLLYVKEHPNYHGPGVLREGRLVLTHDRASHERELDFWRRRAAHYEAA